MNAHVTEASTETADAQVSQTAHSAGQLVEGRQASAPVAASADPMVAMIERMASDRTIDLDRLKTIVELRGTMEADAARKAFNVALARCKAEIPQVVKNAENTDNHSRYATLDKIGEAVDGVIAKHGFSTSFNPAPSDKAGFLKVECVVAHSSGHERSYEAELPIDAAGKNGTVNKTPIHAWKSTMTYGRRALIEMIFDVKSKVATPDDDGNAAGGKVAGVINDEQVGELRSLILEANPKPERIKPFTDDMLKYVGAESVEAMTLVQFQKARLAIKKQIDNENKGRAA